MRGAGFFCARSRIQRGCDEPMPLHKLERAQQRRASLKSLSERAAQLLADDDDVVLTFRE
jgi:hypothetical protein